MSIDVLYQQGRRAASFGLSVSIGLGVVKLCGGLFGGSIALVSDAAHSLVDAVLSTFLLCALKWAERPADREHPYGHGRVEALAGQLIALILMALAVGIGWGVIAAFGNPYKAPKPFTLAIAALGAIVQEMLFQYTSRIARQSGSTALLATAWDYRLDALGSVAVLLGVAAARWGGPAWHWADHAAAFIVAATIFWVGASLLWENVQGLMDRQADPETLARARSEAQLVPGVRNVEKLRIRKAGLDLLVDIHIEVDPNLTVREGHTIAHRVKAHLIDSIPSVRDVLVHVEPDDGEPPTQSENA